MMRPIKLVVFALICGSAGLGGIIIAKATGAIPNGSWGYQVIIGVCALVVCFSWMNLNRYIDKAEWKMLASEWNRIHNANINL